MFLFFKAVEIFLSDKKTPSDDLKITWITREINSTLFNQEINQTKNDSTTSLSSTESETKYQIVNTNNQSTVAMTVQNTDNMIPTKAENISKMKTDLSNHYVPLLKPRNMSFTQAEELFKDYFDRTMAFMQARFKEEIDLYLFEQSLRIKIQDETKLELPDDIIYKKEKYDLKSMYPEISQSNNKKINDDDTYYDSKGNTGYFFLGLLVPLLGIILYFSWRYLAI